MKSILVSIVAAVLLVGCGNPEADRALLDAVKGGNIEAVKQHLAAGADVNAKDDDGRTTLLHAAYQGNNEIAELLLANGADVNAKNDVGDTPLDYWAEMNTEGETADLLRKHGGMMAQELKAEGK